MENTTPTTAAAAAVEAFLKAVKKDAEMYSLPSEYVTQYLIASLKSMCRDQQDAMAYIQRSTRWMEQDQARQGR